MTLIITLTFFIFVFYFLACFNSLALEHKLFFILCFILSAIILRLVISPELNKDYDGYFEFRNFDKPDSIVTFLLSEPYIYILYNFFQFFTINKKLIFLNIYWFNFFITLTFFVWLALRYDIAIWKKILFFVFYFFLFGFVLLRNGPVYILFAYFFYYGYRGIKFSTILITPFLHISAVPLLVTLFHNSKQYIKYFTISLLILIPLVFFFVMPILSSILAAKETLDKVDVYSKGSEVISIFHMIYLIFISIVILITFLVYKKEAISPILITTIVLYYVFFYFNSVLGFRFSPYLFSAILLFNYSGAYNLKLVKILNILSFLLFPYLLFTLFDTHSF